MASKTEIETATDNTANEAITGQQQPSLNKAANLLGVSELNSLDYRSLNSIRKLSKQFGCMEYDLIKSLCISDITQSSNKNDLELNFCITTEASIATTNAKPMAVNSVNGLDIAVEKMYKRASVIRRKLTGNGSTNSKKATSKSKEPNSIVLIAHNKFDSDQVTNQATGQANTNEIVSETDSSSNTNDSKLRHVVLEKDDNFGFGFIAGSEKPLVIRFVSSSGPARDKLLNGDEIVLINNENVQYASREHVIELIKNTGNKLEMHVKQPTPKSEHSVLLTEEKKATKKIKKHLNKVRFKLENDFGIRQQDTSPQTTDNNPLQSKPNEPLQVVAESPITDLNDFQSIDNGTKTPSSSYNESSIDYVQIDDYHQIDQQFILNPERQHQQQQQNKNIFKVYLENKMIKSFRYDKTTCIKDVLGCLKEKLNLKYIEYFGICIKLNTTTTRHTMLFDETRLLFDLLNEYRNHEFYFRFLFIPASLEILLYKDINAFYYLYEQTCNDVHNDMYGNEINYDLILNLISMCILHDYISPTTATLPITGRHGNLTASKSIKSIMKYIDNEIVLENIIPKSIIQSPFIKQKELKRQLGQQLEQLYKTQYLSKDEIKLEYLKLMSNHVQQFSGYVFLATLLDKKEEVMITIGSNHAISVYTDFKSKTLKNLAKFESIENITVSWHSQNLIRVHLDLVFETKEVSIEKTVDLGLLKEDYLTFLYLLQGFLRVFVYPLKNSLCAIHELQTINFYDLNIPAYLVRHPQIDNNQKVSILSPIQSRTSSKQEYFQIDSHEQKMKQYKNSLIQSIIEPLATAAATDNEDDDQHQQLRTVTNKTSFSKTDLNQTLKRNLHHELIQHIRERVKLIEKNETERDRAKKQQITKFDNFIKLYDTTEYIDETGTEESNYTSDQSDGDTNSQSIMTHRRGPKTTAFNQSLENVYLYNIKV